MRGALVITGPTASGKSGLTYELARYVDIEVISADSAQVYRGMDIGTAKPNAETLAQVPHHLLDVRDPEEPYSAADFREDAIRIATDVMARGKLPVICGGTMLYLKALKEGLARLPAADEKVRRDIADQAAREGWESLHQELQENDPVTARRIWPTDTQRLQRAIEVQRLTGVALSELHLDSMQTCPFPLLEIALFPPDRAALHQAIHLRFTEMLRRGFIEEVRALRRRPGVHASLPAIKAVGYRQIWSYLGGEIDEATMMESAVAATRQLAKRQYTWLRGWQDLHLLDFPDTDQALKIISNSTILG